MGDEKDAADLGTIAVERREPSLAESRRENDEAGRETLFPRLL